MYNLYLYTQLVDAFEDVFPQLGDTLFDQPSLFICQNEQLFQNFLWYLAQKGHFLTHIKPVYPNQLIRQTLSLIHKKSNFFPKDLSQKTIIYKDDLSVLIYQQLHEALQANIEHKSHPLLEFSSMKNYLSAYKNLNFHTQQAKLIDFSNQIAHIFNEYELNMPELIACWQKNQFYFSKKKQTQEDWQKCLWQILLTQSEYIHLGTAIELCLQNLPNQPTMEFQWNHHEYKKILLLSSYFLSKQELNFILNLDQIFHLSIQHSLFFPNSQILEKNSNRNTYHWDTLAQHALQIMKKKKSIHWHFPKVISHSTGALQKLHYLLYQSEAKELICPQAPASQDSLDNQTHPLDHNFHILEYTEPLRLSHIIKDKILSIMQIHPNLKWQQIAILAPDIQEFAYAFASTFPSQDPKKHIPYYLHSQDNKTASYWQGVIQMLNWPHSVFDINEITQWATNPYVLKKQHWDTEQVQQIMRHFKKLNVQLFLDEKQKKQMHLGSDDFSTWEKAFRQITMGFFYHDQQSIHWNKTLVIPYELTLNEQIVMAEFIQMFNNIQDEIQKIKEENLTLEQWSQYLQDWIYRYLYSPDWATRSFSSLLSHFEQLQRDLNTTKLYQFEFVQYWLIKAIKIQMYQYQSYYQDKQPINISLGVHLGSISEHRAANYEHVFVIGLSENYPHIHFDDALKLYEQNDSDPDIHLAIQEHQIQLWQPEYQLFSQANFERLSFLEILWSAKSSLTLAYPYQDPITLEPLGSSPMIQELSYLWEDHWGNMVERHPAEAFNSEYFTHWSSLFTFEQANFQLAQHWQGEMIEKVDSLNYTQQIENALNTPLRQSFSMTGLLHYLRNPLSFFSQNRFNIYLKSNKSPSVTPEFPVFSALQMCEHLVENNQLELLQNDDFWEHWQEKQQALNRYKPHGSFEHIQQYLKIPPIDFAHCQSFPLASIAKSSFSLLHLNLHLQVLNNLFVVQQRHSQNLMLACWITHKNQANPYYFLYYLLNYLLLENNLNLPQLDLGLINVSEGSFSLFHGDFSSLETFKMAIFLDFFHLQWNFPSPIQAKMFDAQKPQIQNFESIKEKAQNSSGLYTSLPCPYYLFFEKALAPFWRTNIYQDLYQKIVDHFYLRAFHVHPKNTSEWMENRSHS